MTFVDEAEEHLYPDVRERAIGALRLGLTTGRMSLTQFEAAMDTAMRATREAELVELVRTVAPPVRITSRERRLTEPLSITTPGLFQDIRLRGNWQVPRELRIQTGPSKIILDLTEAEFDDWNVDIRAQTGFGDVIVIVPRGMAVQLIGVSGTHNSKLEPPTPGYPVVRLSVMIGIGRLRLKHPRLSRAEKKALKA